MWFRYVCLVNFFLPIKLSQKMRKGITILVLTVVFHIYGFSQIRNSSLIDSVLNNQLCVSKLEAKLIWGDKSHQLIKDDFSYNNFAFECDNDSEIIVQIGDSLYIYDFDLDTTTFITKAIHGISASFGYIGGNENKIVTAANWDSIYYYNDISWGYSGYFGNSNSDLIHIGSGNKSTYLMGVHLWHFNGNNNPKLIRNNIFYSIADLAVDERENAWVLTGTNWPISDTLRIIDSTGTSLCDIPFIEPVNTFNGYGMMIRNGKAVIGFGPQNPIYPNSLVPLEVSPSGDYVSFGNPILQGNEFTIDLAGCSKNILSPNCNVTNLKDSHYEEGIINVWPNPFNDRLFISSNNQTISSIKIVDVYGRSYLVSYNNSLSNTELNVSNYPNGIYIIYVELNGEIIEIKKLIKRYPGQ